MPEYSLLDADNKSLSVVLFFGVVFAILLFYRSKK